MSRRPHFVPIPVDAVRRPGLVWPAAVDPTGTLGPTRSQARGPHWERSSVGYFVPRARDPDLAVEQRIVSAAWIAIGTGVVTGWAALRWSGARYLDGRDHPVDLVVPSTLRRQPGVRATEEDLSDDEVIHIDGLDLTTHVRSTAFAARRAPDLAQAVNVLDRAAAADLISLDELRAYVLGLAGARGVTQLRAALELTAENSWSPMETEMRLLWRRIGLTEVVCNAPVFDLEGRHIGTPDLLAPEVGLAGEYNGADHFTRERRTTDIGREAAFRRVGLEHVEMIATDRRAPAGFLTRTEDAVARCGGADRRWTLEPPPWWRPTVTVAQRRALSDADRWRLLGWQRDRRDGRS